jgi:hypothetical protein
MKTTQKNNVQVDKDIIREKILKSMIASFKIENIHISEKTAHEIYQRVRKKIRKVA